jgi:hypothetical protein
MKKIVFFFLLLLSSQAGCTLTDPEVMEMLQTLQAQNDKLLEEINQMKGQLTALDGKYQVILAGLADNKKELEALKSQMDGLKTQIASQLVILNQLIAQLEVQGADLEKLSAEIVKVKASIEELKALMEELLAGKSPVPTNGLVGWWPFNGNTNDESSFKNNAQNFGAVLSPDRFGNSNQAYSFNSTYLVIPHISHYDFENFSISVWMKTNQTTTAVLLKQNDFQTAQKERFSIAINDQVVNNIQLAVKYNQINCNPGSGWQKNEKQIVLNNNEFHHFVGIVQDGVTKIFLDGQLINTLNTSFPTSSKCFGGDIQVGREWSTFPRFFQGTIDDIAIWNRSLTAEEISKIYKGEKF